MRASVLALLLLSACDFSCGLEPIDPFAPDYFGDGLIIHRPTLREGMFSARAETRVRLYFAGLENSYADR